MNISPNSQQPQTPILSIDRIDVSNSTVNFSGRDQYNVYPGRSEHEKVFQWLCGVIPSVNYNTAIAERLESTGSWFLNGTQFRRWKLEADLFLWIHGTPGTGKTVLSASIIEDIICYCETEPSFASAYFFFDGRDAQQEVQVHGSLIRSLIRQFSACLDGIPDPLMALYKRCHYGDSQPTISALEATLMNILDAFQHAYVVIDSLDECTERRPLLNWIQRVNEWKKGKLHLLVTSREEEDIAKRLRLLTPNHVRMAPEHVNADIEKYVDHMLQTEDELQQWDEAVREKIKFSLLANAGGMFRLVALQIKELQDCYDEDALEAQIRSLPRGLHNVYDRIIFNIPRKHREDVLKFLHWLAFSARPLFLEEIAQVVGVVSDTSCGFRFKSSRVYRDPRLVLHICASLVTLADGIIKLAHMSVKDYLLSNGPELEDLKFRISDKVAHGCIAQTCLAYLLQFDSPNMLTPATKAQFPLADYAARYWVRHLRMADGYWLEDQERLLAAFFQPLHYPSFLAWVQLFDMDKPWKGQTLGQESAVPSALYYASLAGLFQVVPSLLDGGADISAEGGNYGNALQAATCGGFEKIVKVLLERGADANATGGIYGNALHAASSQGYVGVVKLLLEHGAEVNSVGEKSHSTPLLTASLLGHYEIVKLLLEYGASIHGEDEHPLHAASQGGNEGVVRLLLQKGADVNAVGGNGSYALEVASFEGHEGIVQLLLAYGAKINIWGHRYGTALQAAAGQGHYNIANLLLQWGANVNAHGGPYGYALQAASAKGHEKIVELLLGEQADINSRGGFHGTALLAASTKGHTGVVKLLLDKNADVHAESGKAIWVASCQGNDAIISLLLEKGVNINGQGKGNETALQGASFHGHETTVKLLVEYGATINLVLGPYATALQAACFAGHIKIVQFLLEKGADTHIKGGKYGSALEAAAIEGHYNIVQILLQCGAPVNTHGGPYGNALQSASCGGHFNTVKLLLEYGANVNAVGGRYGTAIQAASSTPHIEIVSTLLESGANVNHASQGFFGNALQAASCNGHEATVRLLLNKGAGVNAQGGYYGNALQAASYNGNSKLVELLIEKGAKINAQGGFFGNALQAACCQGHENIVKTLLEKGADLIAEGGHYHSAYNGAKLKKHDKIVELLQEAAVDL